jgi:hypothetical protein
MSFILDALRKSEKKRPAGVAPDLRTEHFAPSMRSRRKASPLLLVLSAALLLNAALLIWWLRPWQPATEQDLHSRRADRLRNQLRRPRSPGALGDRLPPGMQRRPLGSLSQALTSRAGIAACRDPGAVRRPR